MISPPVIAIVDDDDSVRQAMGRLLSSLDLAVELYASGPELLQSASIDKIACVITDVQMPEMNGFVLCQELRKRGASMPVIFMTAFAQEGYKQHAQAVGATSLLYKPFQDIDIIRCIERALRLGGTNR